ncbi:hypothetical protein ACUNV4_28090 [Granulosicoccus sp. 3-233]|uniref:hypothetical protein n=1 Tax=Granulosicoccus sp. 3-233 TaxID=3417969 RepID=UPI003D339822
MAILLVPMFFVSLVYLFVGIHRANSMGRLFLTSAIGLIVKGISFPVVTAILNDMTGGYIETDMSAIWSDTRSLTPQKGDIYIGGAGVIVVVVSAVLLTLQMVLARRRSLTDAS